MQITGIETIPVEVPVKNLGDGLGNSPYVSGGRLSDIPDSYSFDEALDAVDEATESGHKLLVRLRTDEGVDGWGEIYVPSPEVGRAIYQDIIGPELKGKSVWEMESLAADFDGFESGYYRDVTPYVGAADVAMWDALGKHLDQPVHRLLGGKRQDSVPVAYCLGLLSPEESRRHARTALENGFSVLKTKGSRYWETDVERIEAMHDEVDGELEFRLDPNQIWQFDQAVRVGAQLEDAGIYLQYLEQPIRIDTFQTYARMRDRLRTPIAVNEDAYMQRNLFQLGRDAGIDAAVADMVPAGGFTGFKRLAGVASDMGISLAHHSNFDLGIKNAAKIQAMATSPACDLPVDSVYYAYEDHLFENPLEIEDGRMRIPDRPGLNGAIDNDKLETYRLD